MIQWKAKATSPQGILCGSDSTQEWLLPWWWSRYRDHNDFPVTFCDFGMSGEAKKWCGERGSVIEIDVDSSFITSRKQIEPALAAQWESLYGESLWKARRAWFKKPFALLATPYTQTIWIDTDCEILTSVAPLFETCAPDVSFALAREPTFAHLPEIKYNGGVMVYRHGTDLVAKWAEGALSSSHLFWGDDPLLSHVISQERYPVHEISELWNWRMSYGFTIHAKIFHWVGSGGKGFIRERGGIKPSLDAFYKVRGKKDGYG